MIGTVKSRENDQINNKRSHDGERLSYCCLLLKTCIQDATHEYKVERERRMMLVNEQQSARKNHCKCTEAPIKGCVHKYVERWLAFSEGLQAEIQKKNHSMAWRKPRYERPLSEKFMKTIED